MTLRDRLVRLADEHPELVVELFPLLDMATGAHCCRKASPASERALRQALIRLAHEDAGLRGYLLPLVTP